MDLANKIGLQFEKYIQRLLKSYGIRAEHNLLYHKGKKTHQIDLEYRTGLLFKTKTIIECKYVGRHNALNFPRAYIQLGKDILFTGSDVGILVTNAVIEKKEKKEDFYHIKIYEVSDLLVLRYGTADPKLCSSLEKEIRSTPFCRDDVSHFIHRYI